MCALNCARDFTGMRFIGVLGEKLNQSPIPPKF